jgi:hypothetical protein
MSVLSVIMVASVLSSGVSTNTSHKLRDMKRMSCGGSGRLCGVLVLESGFGTGYYKHDEPTVHGLWPQVPPFGDSSCAPPVSSGDMSGLPACYKTDESSTDPAHQEDFVDHEWTKHGECSGAESKADFFHQVCGLSQSPLDIMVKHHQQGSNLDALADDLRSSGFSIHDIDEENGQLMLAACASRQTDGSAYEWRLAAEDQFGSLCAGSSDPTPSPSPSPVPTPSPSQQCVPGQRGPACSQDSDCTSISGCTRCAHSGFCTNEGVGLEAFFA